MVFALDKKVNTIRDTWSTRREIKRQKINERKNHKMNIRKTIITAAVALTTVAMIAPMGASAITAADLQAQINALMAQLQQLQGPSSGTPVACIGVSFTRYIRVGMSGSDVKCLQAIL